MKVLQRFVSAKRTITNGLAFVMVFMASLRALMCAMLYSGERLFSVLLYSKVSTHCRVLGAGATLPRFREGLAW